MLGNQKTQDNQIGCLCDVTGPSVEMRLQVKALGPTSSGLTLLQVGIDLPLILRSSEDVSRRSRMKTSIRDHLVDGALRVYFRSVANMVELFPNVVQ